MRLAISHRQGIRLVLAVLLSVLAGCGSPANRTLEETFEQVYKVQPTANVTITNCDGTVFVYGSNVNEARVEATKRAFTRERLKQIAINVSVQQGSISINTKLPPKRKWALFDRSGTVDYTIVLPATANISELDMDAGEVFVDGMRGQTVKARLGSGQMFDHNCFGNLMLAVDRGTLTLAYDWWEARKFSIQANITRGNAWAFLPSDAAFHLVAETGDGKIANDFEESAKRRIKEVTKVDMLVRGGGEAGVTMHAREGNIKILEAHP